MARHLGAKVEEARRRALAAEHELQRSTALLLIFLLMGAWIGASRIGGASVWCGTQHRRRSFDGSGRVG